MAGSLTNIWMQLTYSFQNSFNIYRVYRVPCWLSDVGFTPVTADGKFVFLNWMLYYTGTCKYRLCDTLNFHFLTITTALRIHFCNENHWGLSSYLHSQPSKTLTAGLQIQLAKLYGHLESSREDAGLTIHNIPVQRQGGLSDYGQFVIAFAFHAALGKNMKDITF